MIQPIITANQAIANRTMLVTPITFGRTNALNLKHEDDAPVQVPVEAPAGTITTDSAKKGEKLDINFEGCREYSLNGNKINYFA